MIIDIVSVIMGITLIITVIVMIVTIWSEMTKVIAAEGFTVSNIIGMLILFVSSFLILYVLGGIIGMGMILA